LSAERTSCGAVSDQRAKMGTFRRFFRADEQTMPKTTGQSVQPRMTIYLDTMLWNELCDQNADATTLTSSLAAQNKALVIGAEAIYEMAKTFKSNPNRGKELFRCLKKFTDTGVPGVKDNPMLLLAEADLAMSGRKVDVEVFWDEVNAASMRKQIEKLSNGIVDEKATELIESRLRLAATERMGISSHYAGTSTLKSRLSRVSPTDLSKWITKEAQRSAHRGNTRPTQPACRRSGSACCGCEDRDRCIPWLAAGHTRLLAERDGAYTFDPRANPEGIWATIGILRESSAFHGLGCGDPQVRTTSANRGWN
jgi:hypothetical protein